MKNVLFVSGIQIFPPESGGQLRSANLCQSLVKLGFTVEIYSFTGRKAEYLDYSNSSSAQITYNLNEYVNRNPLLGIAQYLFYKLKWPPFWLTLLTHFYIPKILKKKLQYCDTLILDFPFLYPIAKKTVAPLLVNTHNAEFELYKKKPIIARMVKKIELIGFKKAETVIFCHGADQKKFSCDYLDLELKSKILPNGIDLSDFNFNKEDRISLRKKHNISDDQLVLLFTGSKFGPNIAAFEFLSNWSHENALALQKLKIVLMIVGTVSETPTDSPYLKIVGKVPLMKPYFWASDFGLNPINSGSGTNVKMIEFLAAKLPILTTPFGARGLTLIKDISCISFHEADFLSAIVQASKTSVLERKEMAQKAYVENQHIIDMTYALKSLNLKW